MITSMKSTHGDVTLKHNVTTRTKYRAVVLTWAGNQRDLDEDRHGLADQRPWIL